MYEPYVEDFHMVYFSNQKMIGNTEINFRVQNLVHNFHTGRYS